MTIPTTPAACRAEQAEIAVINTPEFQEKFWKKVHRGSDTDCWLWKLGLSEGYGRIKFHGVNYRAHRVVYMLTYGEIPAGMVLDHLCRNRACCNPAHLECVENAENVRRGEGITAKNSEKTHCPKGHPYEGRNLRIGHKGKRSCRECDRQRVSQRWLKSKEERKKKEGVLNEPK